MLNTLKYLTAHYACIVCENIYALPLVLCEQNMGNKFIIAVIIRESPLVSENPIKFSRLFVVQNHVLDSDHREIVHP